MKFIFCLLFVSLMIMIVIVVILFVLLDVVRYLYVVKVLFGVICNDDYYWLCDDKCENKDMLVYLQVENVYVDQVLVLFKLFEDILYKEIVGCIKQDDFSVLVCECGYWYYSCFEIGQDYLIYVCCKGSMEVVEEILLDVNVMVVGKGYFSVGLMEVSQDNQLLVWVDDDVGCCQYMICFKDLVIGKVLFDVIIGSFGDLVWVDDNCIVLYVENDLEMLLIVWVKKYVLGILVSVDIVVYEEKDDSFYMGIGCICDDCFIIIGVYSIVFLEECYVLVSDLIIFIVLVLCQCDVEYDVDYYDGCWVICINDGVKNFKLVIVLIDVILCVQWKDWIVYDDVVFIEGFELFDSYIVIVECFEGLECICLLFKDGCSDYVKVDELVYLMGLGDNIEVDMLWLCYVYILMIILIIVFELNIVIGECC